VTFARWPEELQGLDGTRNQHAIANRVVGLGALSRLGSAVSARNGAGAWFASSSGVPTDERRNWLLATALIAACSPEPQALPELQHYSEGFAQLQRTESWKIDILIVLDNSSSMAEEQALLADNIGAFIDVLEDESIDADYRLAITTTDAGHPACPSSTPERGAFQLTPCTSRLDEFVADGEGGPSDVRARACTDICTLDSGDLAISATTTDEDPNPTPRPWIERVGGHSNLPAGVDLADALSCFAPQGVAGCDFEMPLESMYQALLRAKDANDPAYGFLRKDAMLMVLIVTDEDDCSPAPGAAELFSPDANPTSATCWNAGVTCVGDPSAYDICEAVNKDLAGNEGVPDADAVLRPPSRYVELFDAIMQDKLALDPAKRPILQIIAGAAPSGKLHFGDGNDSDFQQTYGIGPGCTAPGDDPDRPIRAIPPARLRATQQALLGFESMYSVCDDWVVAFDIFGWSGPQLRPGCFPHCALDTDPSTPALEPDCIVEEELPDGSIRHIEECVRDEQGYVFDPVTNDYQLPPDADVCHVRLVDSSWSTPDPSDDMSEECAYGNMNLEFRIARRPGHPAEGGTRVTATCSLTEHRDLVCPGLGD
jgi:hypothetical protein